MKLAKRTARLGLAVYLLAAPASAADDVILERLVTCHDSWIDWRTTNDPQMAQFAAQLSANYTQNNPGDPYMVPRDTATIAGARVLQVYPESVGMGVGFSVMLAVPFDKAKTLFAQKLGKPLTHCETSDGMKSCDLQVADKRTFMITANDRPGESKTLVGCFYYYEK
jgi:hypothetical protein